jgi:putative tryptophan/tyrosine transport system substrate-binding protein
MRSVTPRRGRRRFLRGSLALGGLSLLVGCGQLALPGQEPRKVYRVGIVGEQAADPAVRPDGSGPPPGLREHGWIEGENLLIEHRWAEGDSSRIPDLAADLVRLPVDLIVVPSSIYTQGAKQATSSIPIVFVSHADPVGTGHVESLARPGGNATGQAVLQTPLGTRLLDVLSAAVPTARKIAVLWHPGTPSHPPVLQALEEPARSIQVQLQPVEAGLAPDLDGAFAAMTHDGAQAVMVLGTPLFRVERQRWAELALRHRLPSICSWREGAEAGALMGYGPNLGRLWGSVAVYVEKILKGTKPADIPVEQAREFDFVINLKTAQTLGLTIPQSVLQQATEIIQ